MISGNRWMRAGRDRNSPAGVDQGTRRQLVALAQRRDTRTSAFSRERPTAWRPTEIRNPDGVLDTHFTDSTAWELIADRLEHGEDVEVIELNKPKGRRGYVMLIDLGPNVPPLYVKLQLGSGQIIGRSFHYSEHG